MKSNASTSNGSSVRRKEPTATRGGVGGARSRNAPAAGATKRLTKTDQKNSPAAPKKVTPSPKQATGSKTNEATKPEPPESGYTQAQPPANPAGGHDVMLSYNWGHQEIAFKVRDYFRSKGNLSVWIDVEQMSGDMNTKMAQAIIKSKIVIMCLSKKYQDSANCKKEYEYTDKKQKKFIPLKVEDNFQPEDGTSLDLILGSQLYYCIEKDSDFESNMPKVLDIILGHLQRK